VDQEEILSRYRGFLMKTARSLAPRRPNEWVDLSQEGWIAMWKALATFDPSRGSEAAWLTTAARLAMVDCLRRDLWTGTLGKRGHVRERPAVPVDTDWDWTERAVTENYDAALMAYHDGEVSAALSTLSEKDLYKVREIMTDQTRYRFKALPERLRSTLACKLGHLVEES
jgi:RNA polymerase sigma factor (sigma-70 family)